jgi:LacI family transcriptional regulator
MALGALRALHESGVQVPGDVSVVGFDDIRQARYFEPPLTTVNQDFNALAKQSVEYLIDMIEDKTTTIHQRVLYPELIVRESTSVAQIAG